MANPENAVEILHEYLPDGLAARLADIAERLEDILLPLDIRPLENEPRAVNQARRDLRGIVGNPSFAATLRLLQEVNTGIYDLITHRELAAALPKIPDGDDPGATLPALDTQKVQRALRTQEMEFSFEQQVGGELVVRHGTLRGLAGPGLNASQRTALLEFHQLIAGGPERDFRFGVLRGECKVGLGNFADGLEEYFRLIRAGEISTTRRRFAAIRAGFGRLAKGDAVFRSARTLDADGRDRAIFEYDEAVALIRENGVAADNPQRIQIERHAEQQKAKLAARLNPLGLRDGFVPVQRFTQLRGEANAGLDAADASTEKLKSLLEQAEALIGQQMDLQQQRKEEELTQAITSTQVVNAGLGEAKVREQIRLLEEQQDFLGPGAAAAALGAIFQGAAAAVGKAPDTPGAGIAVAGVTGAVVSFFAQREELGHQQRIAEIEARMAHNETLIAELHDLISASRLAFLQEKLDFIANKRINADLLYILAELTERRLERQLERSITLAYLFERAIAFYLGKPEVAHIDFDYRDRPGGIFDAASALRDDFDLVADELNNPALEKIDFFEEIVSLRESYPLQFSRFLQTGAMTFEYSLYQLGKDHPASHQCRLREVGVELSPRPPVTGFDGTLTHTGRFLVRDKLATLKPSTNRLIPTDEQLNLALKRQLQGSAVTAVGGILCYNLGRDTKELSLNTQFVSPPPEQPTLDILEGYAPTGVWELDIQDHGSLGIEDILLHFAVVSQESDTSAGGLGDKVKQLTRSYETELANGDRLDRISPFSLLNAFPDTFFALEDGPAALQLNPEHFPRGLINLQFKAMVVQALDPEARGLAGIGLEIRRPDAGFGRVRVTLDGGFTEDLDSPLEILDIDERFPMVGDWELRLSDPGQFSQLGDLRLFFMYAFEEAESS